MKLTEVLMALRQWLARVALPAQVLTDFPDRLRVILETEHALAER